MVLESSDGHAWIRRNPGIGQPGQPVEVAGGPSSTLLILSATDRSVELLRPHRQEPVGAIWPAGATMTPVNTAGPGWILGGFTPGPLGPDEFVATTTDGATWTQLEEPGDGDFGHVRSARRDGTVVTVLEGAKDGGRLWSLDAEHDWSSVTVDSRGAVLLEARGKPAFVDDRRVMVRCSNGGRAARTVITGADNVEVLDAIAVGDDLIAVGEAFSGSIGRGWFGWVAGAADQPGSSNVATSCVRS